MSIFCTELSLSTGQSNTLVFVGLGRVDQEFGACRMQVRAKGAAREGERAAASQAEQRRGGRETGRWGYGENSERESNRSLPREEPNVHCTVLVLARPQNRGPNDTVALSLWSMDEKIRFPHPTPSELRIKGTSQFPPKPNYNKCGLQTSRCRCRQGARSPCRLACPPRRVQSLTVSQDPQEWVHFLWEDTDPQLFCF